MIEYHSPKYTLYASRLTNPFQRSLRKECYLWTKDICGLKISQVIAIRDGRTNTDSVFIKANEDKKNFKQVMQDCNLGMIDKLAKKFDKIVADCKKSRVNVIDKAFLVHRRVGAVILYSHYLDRVVRAMGGRKDKFIKLAEKLRNLVFFMDSTYLKARKFVGRSYKGNVDNIFLDEWLGGVQISKQEECNRENGFCAMVFSQTGYKILYNKMANNLLARLGFIKKVVQSKNSSVLFGVTAFGKRKASGEVLIVGRVGDLKNKNLRNKIIVAPMTMAEFTPYLKKVSGIITDEGGINCHAAIAAREFKIPCIVGAKTATQVFKNGEFVEIDTAHGIIKKYDKTI